MAAKPLQDIIFGNPVQPRYQPPKQDVFDWLTEISALTAVAGSISQGARVYDTLSAAVAAIGTLPENQAVQIRSDGTNNGVYYKPSAGATSFTYLGLNLPAVEEAARVALFGTVVNVASTEPGFYSRTDGTRGSSSGFKRTALLPVGPATRVTRTGSSISASSAAGTIVFFDKNRSFIGAAGNGSATSNFLVGDLYAAAAFIGVTNVDSTALTLTLDHRIARSRVEGLANLGLLEAAFVGEFFATDTTAEYVGVTGSIRAADGWTTTAFVPAKVGDKFQLTCQGTAQVAALSLWDKFRAFLGPALVGDQEGIVYTVADPAVAFVRSSAVAADPKSLVGPRNAGAAADDGSSADFAPSAFVPDEILGLAGEDLYLYLDGICPDQSVDVMCDLDKSNREVVVISKPAATTLTMNVRARRGSSVADLGSSTIRIAGAPINPAAPRNLLFIGESLMSLGNGACVQEVMRRLTGTGTALTVPGVPSPAPLALTNLIARGTRGSGPVRHEGRAGWSASTYLNSAGAPGDEDDPDVKSNAFWNPATSQFDLAYYIAQNDFGSAATPGGITPSGDNLTVLTWLVWNGVYAFGPAEDAVNLSLLIDRIHATHPMADVLVIGAQPAAEINNKHFNGSRFVSRQEVFELAVKGLGNAHKQVCAEKARCEFVPVAHVFDARTGLSQSTQKRGARTNELVTGASDYVHPAAAGYGMIADAIFYKLIHKYCGPA